MEGTQLRIKISWSFRCSRMAHLKLCISLVLLVLAMSNFSTAGMSPCSNGSGCTEDCSHSSSSGADPRYVPDSEIQADDQKIQSACGAGEGCNCEPLSKYCETGVCGLSRYGERNALEAKCGPPILSECKPVTASKGGKGSGTGSAPSSTMMASSKMMMLISVGLTFLGIGYCWTSVGGTLSFLGR